MSQQPGSPKRLDGNQGSGTRRSQNLAIQILNGDTPIYSVGNDIYQVPSQSSLGMYYNVNLQRPTCSCPAWRKQKYPCKHVYAARMFKEKTVHSAPHVPQPNPYENPPDYDRVRDAQRRCIRELLRCMGIAVTAYSANGGFDHAA